MQEDDDVLDLDQRGSSEEDVESVNLDIEINLRHTNILGVSTGPSSTAGSSQVCPLGEYHRPGSRNLHAHIVRSNIFSLRKAEKSFHRLLRRSNNPHVATLYQPSIRPIQRASTPAGGLPPVAPRGTVALVGAGNRSNSACSSPPPLAGPKETLRNVLLDLRQKVKEKPVVREHNGDLRPTGTSATAVYDRKLRSALLSCTDACSEVEEINNCFPENIFIRSPRQNPDVLLETRNVRRELQRARSPRKVAQHPVVVCRPSTAEVSCQITPTPHVVGVTVAHHTKPTSTTEHAMRRYHAVREVTSMRASADMDQSVGYGSRSSQVSLRAGTVSNTLSLARDGVVKKMYNR